MRSHACPLCRAEMKPAQVGPADYVICAACRGAYFTRTGLEQVFRQGGAGFKQVLDQLAGPGHPPDAVIGKTCPHCEAVLRVVEYPSVPGARLGSCGLCLGFWVEWNAASAILRRLAAPSKPAPGTAETPAKPAPAAKPAARRAAPPTAADLLSSVASPPPSEAKSATAGPTVSRTPPRAPEPSGPPRPPGARPGFRPPSASTTGPVGPKRPRQRPGERPCPECSQPNAENASVCWACGYLFKGPVVGTCPRCEGSFHRFMSDGIPVDLCDGCGGTWLERGRLSALAFQEREAKDRILEHQREVMTGRIRKLSDPILCPGCGLIMFPHPIGTLTQHPIHTCVQCQATFVMQEALEEALSH